jgi:hypothetical protein
MRKIHEVLRLHFEHGRPKREIARIINVSPTTVSDYLARATLAGLGSPCQWRSTTPPSNGDCFHRPSHRRCSARNRPGRRCTRSCAARVSPSNCCGRNTRPSKPTASSTAFCEHYRRWRQRLTLSMRQTHTPGEKLFIDYAGQTVSVTDGSSGEIREAQVFVAVLGASNYTFIEATWSQQQPDWIGSHVRARLLRRLPAVIVS